MKFTKQHNILMLLENNPYNEDDRVKREALALVEAGYNVTVICPRPAGGKFYVQLNQNLQLYQYPLILIGHGVLGYLWEYGYSFCMMFAISLLVWWRHNFTVVHAHNPPDILFPIGAFYKILGKRFVFDHHDASPELFLVRFDKHKRHYAYRLLVWFEQLTCRLADHVITTNESHKRLEMARGGVAAEDITIVRNGPTESLKATAPDEALRNKAQIILGYVGIIGPQDGLDYLLRALHHLVYELDRRDLFCVIIGKSDISDELEALAHSLALDEYVWFTGWVSHEELLRYLSTVDICLDPDPSNIFNDHCTMIKMMEYMALGKPIVAFDLPEHRISAANAALYATANDERDFAEKIALLMDNATLRHSMGQIGKERVATNLAWVHQKQQLVIAYDKLHQLSYETKPSASM